MAEDVVIVIRVDDKGSKALAAAGAATADLGKKTRRTSKAMGGASKASSALKGGLGLAKAGAIGLAVEAVNLIGVLAGVVAGAKKALDAFREQDAVNRDLADSLARTGLEGEALDQKYQDLQATASEFATKTLFGDEQILASMAKYSQLTGDAQMSTEQLSTVLGIAAKQQIDADKAAEKYARAMKGEVDALKELTPITKAQAEELNKLDDEAKKSARAQEILQQQFAGTAEGISPTFNAIKNLEDAKGDLVQKIGEVIEASGVVPVILEPVTKVFRSLESAIGDNNVMIQTYIVNGVLKAVQGFKAFLIMLRDNVEYVGASITTIKLFGEAFLAVGKVVNLLVDGVSVLVGSALSGLFAALQSLLSLAATAADKLGQDGLAANLRIASDTADGMADTFGGVAKGSMAKLEGGAASLGESFGSMADDISNADADVAMAGKGLDATLKTVEGIEKKIEKTRANITDMRKSAPRTGGGGGGGAPPTPPKDEARAEREKAEAKRKQAEYEEKLAGIKLEALRAADPMEKAALEYQARQLEIQHRGLEGNARELAMTEAALALEGKLVSLEDERARRAEERARAAEQRHQEEMARAEERIATERQEFATISQGLTSLRSGSTVADGLAATLGKSVDAVGELAAETKRVEQGLIDGSEASVSGLAAVGGAAATVADAMGASAAKQAGILALFETAAAAASFAVGNIPSGIQHSIAAATYAAVAATSSARGAGGGAASGGGARTSALGANGRDGARREAERSADILAERLGSELGGAQVVNITFDQRGAVNGRMGPEVENQVAQAAEAGLRRRGYDVGQLKARRRSG